MNCQWNSIEHLIPKVIYSIFLLVSSRKMYPVENPDNVWVKAYNRGMKIELDGNGIYIDGNEVSFPTNVEELSRIFGEPSRKYYANNDWRIIWDSIGVCTSGIDIVDLKFVVHHQEELEHLPEQLFDGEVIVNGIPIQDLTEKTTKVNKYQIRQAQFMGEETQPVYAYWFGKNLDYKEDTDLSKDVVQKITGEPIVFKDFNFKLAVIQELMYNQGLLTPQFNLHEFVDQQKDRRIDINKEGYEPIPEVVEYFKNLEIDSKFANELASIYEDGGNDVYMNIAPFWGGDEDFFTIQSFDDVASFPNLKEMTLLHTDEAEAALEGLKTKGIEVDWL